MNSVLQNDLTMKPHEKNPETSQRMRYLERRWEILAKICRHDLPNQLVVIRGLVNLILEESSKLGSEGREYVRRLSGAADRALEMMQALKTLSAGDAEPENFEEIDGGQLVQELAAEIKKLYPKTEIDYHFSITIPKIQGPPRTLRQALEGLLRSGLAAHPARAVVEVATQTTNQGVEIVVGIAAKERILLDRTVLAAAEIKSAENRFDLLIVRGLVESWGGALRYVEMPGRGAAYVILIPDP
jgi:signal transduction histidine kinase